MKYLESETFLGDSESAEDAVKSSKLLEVKLQELRQQLEALDTDSASEQRLSMEIESCYILLDLDRNDEAWQIAKSVFDRALDSESWLAAVEACDVLYQAEKEDGAKALAHGIWLGVTFPIDPELSVAMLQHLIDETPDNSDGAAVAAATACYIVDLRAEGQTQEDLRFFTNQLMGQVARRHSQVEEQEIFDFWVERMELDDPAKFLPRLATVLEVIVDGEWWYDREALRSKIPAVA
ncbi:MAG: hypothetical protein N0C81_02455 [Candidatus Thiodiazotropha lotti]|uniref:Uncharacterized protein n=1 Tax=Candidatus Thiodiazotropha lotti TaxID=2792787 RepID=A0A9E4N1S2_9GAMM|nr:hypothetical protein [Candidatus Thiodiazotropha lotti]MCG7939859.1 hypothetical protein [Candidatus Thiodiazotropha lotti]MCG7983469.1 hypothetical protein [Candidatus Thiodiazotropha lotti]MCG7987717.1 hypothetical protein [Candidatus Thiodiazotropha lotti]MCG8004976.1 hypothetical protein [Candidatus Thiodiazotropha lotti]